MHDNPNSEAWQRIDEKVREWRPWEEFFFAKVSQNAYILSLGSLRWTQQVWMIDGAPMRVFKWTADFDTKTESSIAPILIGFPELPLHLFHRKALFELALLDVHLRWMSLQRTRHVLAWLGFAWKSTFWRIQFQRLKLFAKILFCINRWFMRIPYCRTCGSC